MKVEQLAVSIHDLYIAHRKNYISRSCFEQYRERYEERVRMLNALERSLERQLPPRDRKWPATKLVSERLI